MVLLYNKVPWYYRLITVLFCKGYLNGCIPFKVEFLRSAVIRSRPQSHCNQVPPDHISVTPDSDSWKIRIEFAEQDSHNAKLYHPAA